MTGPFFIGNQAFEGCSSLEYAEIGDSVDYIGQNAFNGCTSIRYIRVYRPTPPVCDPSAFGTMDKKACELYFNFPHVYDVNGDNFESSPYYEELISLYGNVGEEYDENYIYYFISYRVEQQRLEDLFYEENYQAYRKADVWKDFYEDESIPTSIEKANMEGGAEPKPLEYYGTDGIRTTSPKKGVNIVRMSDGTVRKVIF